MKTKSNTRTSRVSDTALEELIRKKDAELKELARKKAKHFALAQPCLPLSVGDNLMAFIGEFKTGYEQLASTMYHRLQPQAHFPKGRMDSDYVKEKEDQMDEKLKERKDKNRHAEYELQNFHPGSLPLRVILSLGLSFIILSGEVVYNIKSFQLIVENMLFALWLSISTSVAVLIASHAAAFFYKMAKTTLQRRLVALSSLTIISILFYVIALLRTSSLMTHSVYISPFYFVVFNLFFFIVIAFLSFVILPTWEEVKEQYHLLKLYYAIRKGEKEIKMHEDMKDRMKHEHYLTEKERVEIIYYANYLAEQIRKMYYETVQIFIATNRFYRTDGLTPDCFSEPIPYPDIQDITMTFVSQNGKLQ